MAYDRFDPRYDRNETARRGRDRWSERDSPRYRDERDERGFFERAGDEIASWFGDDDDADRRRERERYGDEYRETAWRGERGRFDRPRQPLNEDRYAYRPQSEIGRRSFGSEYDRGAPDISRRPVSRDLNARGSRERDPDYLSWRQRQLDALDRDYDEYRRENQSRFENEFGSWRANRMQKRSMLGTVREQMEVVGNDGEHVGTVDKVAGDRIVLTKSDPQSGGSHHSIGCSMIERIEENRVILDCSAEQAMKQWRDDDRSRALFERDDQGEEGPHVLNRSFEGTYR